MYTPGRVSAVTAVGKDARGMFALTAFFFFIISEMSDPPLLNKY